MKMVEIDQANLPLSSYAKNVGEEPLVLMRGGKPVAALVSVEDADMETIRLSTSVKFLSLIERSRKTQATEGGISQEEMRRRLGV